jgi:F-type H+/Na+-transporting ATPase subunit alpha
MSKVAGSLSFLEEISAQLAKLSAVTKPRVVGTVTAYGDGVVTVAGLDDIQSGELVDLGNRQFGLALNLNTDHVGIVTLGLADKLSVGQEVYGTGRLLSVGVSDAMLGRAIDPLGRPVDGKGELTASAYMPLEKIAPGVMARQRVTVPLQTGTKAIDAMIPIGRGQRELIIGDRSTGKSAIALGTILNQKGQDVICIYVAIGQKRSFISQTINMLAARGALDYTVFVVASASDAASMQFLAPMAGAAVAEHFMQQGKDVLVVYDDLSKHAQAYREISLLLRRPSGREAYPGDIFYLHSRLLERACRLNPEHGGGSITALPIIETQANDVSAFIPTNVISITDGQIYLETDLFNAGVRPAINVGLSVSRVGGDAQVKAMKQVAGSLKLDLAQYRDLEAFAQFGSDLDAVTKKQLDRGMRLAKILNQGWDNPLSVAEQVALIWAATHGHLDTVQVKHLAAWEAEFLTHLRDTAGQVLTDITTAKKLSPEIEAALQTATQSFNDLHTEWQLAAEE